MKEIKDSGWIAVYKMCCTIRDLMAIENKDVILDDVLEIDTTLVGGKPRKCQAEKKGTPHYIPELDEAKEKYEAIGYEFKEGEYKKPCKIGKQKRGKGAAGETVAGIVKRGGDVIAQVIQHTTYAELKELVEKYVDKDNSVLLMDTDTAQVKLHKIIDTIKINHKKLYSYRGINTNSIESFWAIVERQIMGQHHHVSPKYLSKYVTLYEPTRDMINEIRQAGKYKNKLFNMEFEKLKIVTVREILDGHVLKLPSMPKVLKEAKRKPDKNGQGKLNM